MLVSELSKLDDSFKVLNGDPNTSITGISHSEFPLSNSFIFIKTKKYLNALNNRHGEENSFKSGLVIEESFFNSLDKDAQKSLSSRFVWSATVKDVNQAMCSYSKPFYDEKFSDLNLYLDGRQSGKCDIDPNAEIAQNVFIGENVTIAKNVKIASGVVIMPEVEIGEGTIIYPNTTLYPYTKIGRNCRLHANVSIGADGFGFNFFNGKHNKVWHFSGVEIGDDVEIGSASTVDCGAFLPTRVGTGTKIDNGVQIGHNAQIGQHCVICGQVAIAGSVFMEDFVVMGGRAGSAPNTRIGKGAQLAAMTALSENTVVAPGEVLAGYPARPLKEWLVTQVEIRKLGKK